MSTKTALATRNSFSPPSEKELQELVTYIGSNVSSMNQIAIKVTEAQSAVDQARSDVAKAKQAAETAKDLADKRKKQEVHWWNRKADAINAIHDDVQKIAEAQLCMADSQIVLAEAQQRMAEAQSRFFAFQKQLAGATATMIQLSVTSIASNNIVVRELEARLQGASKEKLSELAQQELARVVSQIKAQQDVMSRQNQLAEGMQELDERLALQHQADEIQNKAIEAQAQQGLQRDIRIAEQAKIAMQQQQTLILQQQKDSELDGKISENKKKNAEQDATLTKLIQSHNALVSCINNKDADVAKLKEDYAKMQKKQKQQKALLLLTSVGTILGIALGALHFFI